MSVARVKTSKFAARLGKALRCQKCGRGIEKGETYRWWFVGFRSRYKHVRCVACPYPRNSELESSQKSEAYAALESAQDELDALGGVGEAGDLDAIVAQAAEGVREVAETYREADNAFGGQGATISAEMADELESAADELEGFQAGEFDEASVFWCPEHSADDEAGEDCDACVQILEDAKTAWWDEQVDAARSALDEASF